MSAIYYKTHMEEMPKNCPLVEDKNPVKIMNEDEFTAYLAEIKHELDYMEPGDGKRIALIGTVEGGRNLTPELAFTSSQLRKLFDLGFEPE